MTPHRARHHHHSRTGELCAPTQIDVVTVEGDRRVVPTDLAIQVDPGEHTGGRYHEDVVDCVVLLLVEFAFLRDGLGEGETIDAEPHVL